MRAPSRNKPLEAHQRQFTNKPIGSQQLVGINPPKKKFPRHGRWRPPVKRTYYRQANNGFMIMGQPAPQPQLGIEAITKIIAGIQMREPLRANAIQTIPGGNKLGVPTEFERVNRSLDQVLNSISELRDTQEKLFSRDEPVYPTEAVAFAPPVADVQPVDYTYGLPVQLGSDAGETIPDSPYGSELEGAFITDEEELKRRQRRQAADAAERRSQVAPSEISEIPLVRTKSQEPAPVVKPKSKNEEAADTMREMMSRGGLDQSIFSP